VSAETTAVTLTALSGIPAIQPGDDIAAILTEALAATRREVRDGDVLVVTHKIISKAEDRYRSLADVTPSAEARTLAAETGKDAALVEVVLSESRQVLRSRPELIITEHRLGLVMANAGIDQSNIGGDGARVLLLPEDPDASAAALRSALQARVGIDMAVVVSDSVGRAWRNGVVGLAIGAAGIPALQDLRGRSDLDGRSLKVTQVGLADEVASAAELLMGEADEGVPAVLVQGVRWREAPVAAAALIREPGQDLFR
jgi:coenzyme F420-0:L-glutamate ligase/coenzyme F420-1:gamma-L-glutamate ligase